MRKSRKNNLVKVGLLIVVVVAILFAGGYLQWPFAISEPSINPPSGYEWVLLSLDSNCMYDEWKCPATEENYCAMWNECGASEKKVYPDEYYDYKKLTGCNRVCYTYGTSYLGCDDCVYPSTESCGECGIRTCDEYGCLGPCKPDPGAPDIECGNCGVKTCSSGGVYSTCHAVPSECSEGYECVVQ